MPVTARVCVNQAAAHYREAELFLEQLRQNRGRNQRGEASLKPCLGAAGWLGDGKTESENWGATVGGSQAKNQLGSEEGVAAGGGSGTLTVVLRTGK